MESSTGCGAFTRCVNIRVRVHVLAKRTDASSRNQVSRPWMASLNSQDPLHQHGVPGKGADIIVISGSRRGGEENRVACTGERERSVIKHVIGVRYEVLRVAVDSECHRC